VRPGKRAGAFCATIEPGLTPWVLQSYQGQPRDVATLAHELGHAIHASLAAGHTALTQQATLPLAETASTFGEMLLIDRLLAQDPEPEVRQALLFRQMDDNYATVLRQAYFAVFEKEAHGRVVAGAQVDDLSDLYLETLREQFGDAIELSEDFRAEWLAIPHIYPHALLRLRLRLRPTPGAVALPAISRGGPKLHPALPGDPGRRRLRQPDEHAREGRDRRPAADLLGEGLRRAGARPRRVGRAAPALVVETVGAAPARSSGAPSAVRHWLGMASKRASRNTHRHSSTTLRVPL